VLWLARLADTKQVRLAHSMSIASMFVRREHVYSMAIASMFVRREHVYSMAIASMFVRREHVHSIHGCGMRAWT
jgi:hypothetical protein